MKRSIILAVLLGSALAVFADESRSAWLVATTIPADQALSRLALVPSERAFEAQTQGPSIVLERFRIVAGFAAELTTAEVDQLRKSSVVRYVEPVVERHALEIEPGTTRPEADESQVTPWGVSRVRAPGVWRFSRGKGVKVGIIDTGVDYTHPDLAAAYRGGWDFVNRDDDPMDDKGHGTHVAGTIAARDDLIGVVGVAPEAEIYALKALDETGSGTNLDVIRAVEWAIEHKLDVINLSLGGTRRSDYEDEVFTRALESGVIPVAAAGNFWPNSPTLDYPAAYRAVVSVAALNRDDFLADFSQRGVDLDFSAPGVAIDSTWSQVQLHIADDHGAASVGLWMEFSPRNPMAAQIVDCGLGHNYEFPSSVQGRIALIGRGGITFADKVHNAKAAGAVAAIVYNNISAAVEGGGPFNGTLGGPGDWIPAAAISLESGQGLITRAVQRVTMTEVTAKGYATLQGTSMATPHVAGVFALMRGVKPGINAHTLVETVRGAARDLGETGPDATFGFGAIDAYRSLERLAPELFGTSGEPVPAPEPKRRAVSRRS